MVIISVSQTLPGVCSPSTCSPSLPELPPALRRLSQNLKYLIGSPGIGRAQLGRLSQIHLIGSLFKGALGREEEARRLPRFRINELLRTQDRFHRHLYIGQGL